MQLNEPKRNLGATLMKKELHWKQRAKQFWLKEGDKNTRFFHNMASARRKINSIKRLQRDDGSWASVINSIRVVVKDYYERIFSAAEGESEVDQVLQGIHPSMDAGMNEVLTENFTIEEFKVALFEMHADKSLGPDSFNPAFYQKFWDFLKGDVFTNSVSWLMNESLPQGLKGTNIVLIPKVDNPTHLKPEGLATYCPLQCFVQNHCKS